jgi:hypothetical protein
VKSKPSNKVNQLATLIRNLRFRWNELGLVTRRREISESLGTVLGSTPRLERFVTGHGWGLKYLVFVAADSKPRAVVKTASLLIERRLRIHLGESYHPPSERFQRESALLTRLAGIGLGPDVLLCREEFFARSYIDGQALADLPPDRIVELLPVVLDALEKACTQNIFHTDPAPGNLLVDREGGIKFIDSEIPALPADFSTDDIVSRAFCYQRLLFGLSKLGPVREHLASRAAALISEYGNPPLSHGHVAALVLGEVMPGEAYG